MSMKKFTGLLLAMVMLLSILPTALAANTAAGQVVTAGGKLYYDNTGAAVANGANFPEGNAVVELSKTVASTGVENEFEVTLQVRTTEKVTSLRSDTPDAATMLIFDVSNSMDDCDLCGEEENHSNHDQYLYKCPYGSHNSYYEAGKRGRCRHCGQSQSDHRQVTNASYHVYESRLSKAKAAAISFLEDFANNTGAEADDARYVAIVDFGSMAATRLTWVDVTNPASLASAKAVINSLTVAHSGTTWDSNDAGGTNIEAALMLAANVWESTTVSSVVQDIDYKYTILLTDGNPTYHVSDNADSRNSTSAIYGTRGGGSSTTQADAEDVGDEAKRILDLGSLSKLYSICYGSVTSNNTTTKVWDTKPFQTWSQANPATTNDMTVGQWLTKFSTAAYDGGTEQNLFDSFNSVISQIQLAAQAWKVTDTMGDYAVYGGEVAQTGINNVHSVSDDTLTWDVLNSYTTSLVQTGDYAVLTYTFKYKVTLDNLNSAYTAGAAADTNASATLTYAVLDGSTGLWKVVPAVKFPEPEVKGYAGELKFTKVWNNNGTYQLIEGKQFQLIPVDSSATGTTWSSGTVTSDANGVVTFSNIPSGHDYILVELNPGEYAAPGEMLVSVDWGEAACAKLQSINGATYLVNEKLEKNVTLTLNKSFGSNDHPASIPFVVTGPSGYTRNVTLSASNNWTTTLTGLEPGEYIITEDPTWDGYNVTSSATLNGTAVDVTYHYVKVNLGLEDSQSHAEHTVTFTNTYTQKVGKVSVAKTFLERSHDDLLAGNTTNPALVPLDSELYKAMEIEVDLIDENGQSVATLTLNKSNNWTASLQDIPVGTYTVKENVTGVIDDHEFVHCQISVDGQVREDGKITVGENSTISIALANHYTHLMGDIRVEKAVNGVASDAIPTDHVFQVGVYETTYNAATDTYTKTNKLVTVIEVRQNVSGNWVGQSIDVPFGVYWLEELTGSTAVDGYTFISGVFESQLVDVRDVTASANADLVNTYEQDTGKLTVTKSFVIPENPTNAFTYPEAIYINVLSGGASGSVVTKLELTAENNWTASVDLPLGTYYLDEIIAVGVAGTADVPNFSLSTSWDNSKVEFTQDGQTASRKVTNTYTEDFGKLTINKEITGVAQGELPADYTLTFLIYDEAGNNVNNVTLTAADNWTKTIDLPVGTYKMVERGAVNGLLDEHYTLIKAVVSDGTNTMTVTDFSVETPFDFAITHADVPVTTTVLVENVYAKDTGVITVTKAFAADSELDGAWFANQNRSINVLVYNAAGEVADTLTLNAGNDWTDSTVALTAGEKYTLVEVHTDGAENTAFVKDYILDHNWDSDGVVELTKTGAANTVTNKYTKQTGHLTVRKFFKGLETADESLLKDASITLTVKSADEKDIIHTITLNNGNNWYSGQVTLPVGEYVLEEAAINLPGYTHTGAVFNSTQATLVSSGFKTKIKIEANSAQALGVQLTNTLVRDTGTLTISKAFGADSELNGSDFAAIDVLVKKDGDEYKTVTLRGDTTPAWSVTLENVPTGNYTVEEIIAVQATNTAHKDGYGLHVAYTNNGAVTVEKDKAASETITNTYTKKVGYIKVTKAFADDADTAAATEKLGKIDILIKDKEGVVQDTLTLDRTTGGVATSDPLSEGEYTLEEVVAKGETNSAFVPGYAVVSKWEPSSVAVTDGDTVEAVVTNTYTRDKGVIKVEKKFVGLDESLYADKVIKVDVKQSGVTVTTLELNKTNHWSTSVTLPTGEYTLVEQAGTADVAHHSAEVTYSATKVSVTTEHTASAPAPFVITNTYTKDTGLLNVQKDFEGLNGVALTGKSVTIKVTSVTDANDTRELTLQYPYWSNSLTLPVGSYKLEEIAYPEVDNYTWTGVQFRADDNVGTTLVVAITESGASVDVTATNTYSQDVGTITVHKEFSGESVTVGNIDVQVLDTKGNLVDTLTLSATTNPAWTATSKALSVGTYKLVEVIEKDLPNSAFVADYSVTPSWDNNSDSVAVSKNGNAEKTLTNTYQRSHGYIEVTKIFADDSEIKATDFQGSIQILVLNTAGEQVDALTVNAANWTAKSKALPLGEYKLVEADGSAVANYGLSSTWSVTDGKVALASAGASVTVTNKYTKDTGTIAVEKKFAGDLTAEDFIAKSINVAVKAENGQTVATLALNAAGGWKAESGELPIGKYTLEELNADVDNYGLSAAVTGEMVVDGVVTVNKDTQSAVTLTNTYYADAGKLTINKVLTGAQNLFPSSIDFTVRGDNGYTKTVTLTAVQGWTATIDNIPAGTYTVTEAVAGGTSYAVTTTWSAQNGTVTVAPGQAATLTCTNNYEAKLSIRIPVEKTVKLGGTKNPETISTFSFGARWENAGNVAIRFENDAMNTKGALKQTSANTYTVTVDGAGTVKGYIVIEGYAADLAGFKLQTWEKLTGYADAEAAEADGWTFDETATNSNAVWTVELVSDGKGGVTPRIARTGEAAATKVAFLNTYTEVETIVPPPTGDDSNIALWLTMMLLSMAGFAFVAMRARKQH